MKNIKKLISLILVVAMCFSLVACSTPQPAEPEKEEETQTEQPGEVVTESGKKIFRYSLTADVPTIDPQLMNSIPSSTVGYHIFDGLMRNHVGEIQYGTAESYEVSEDGLVYTFHLRDTKWSDGEPVTAYDYEYGLQRLADPETASSFVFIITSLIKNADKVNAGELPVEELGVKALDEKTLQIELQNPTGYFLSMLSMPQFVPARKDLVEKYGQEYATDADKMAYNGPFVVKEWRQEDRLILVKNEHYWNKDAIKLDEVHILTVADPMTAVAMFEKGELDQVNVPAEILENYSDQVTYYFDGANDYIKLNMDGSNPLKSRDLRLALNYALNREDFILLATKNLYQPNTRFVLPQVKGVEKDYGEEYPYEAFPVKGDPAKAKEHLEKAMAELGVSDPSEIELELLTTDAERTRIEAEILQNQFQTVLGITVNIRQVPYKQRLQMESDRDFEMVVTGWVPDYSDPMSYLELWTTNSDYNHGSYSSEVYDNYIKEALTNTDPKERMDALFNAEKTFCEDGVVVPLQLRSHFYLQNEQRIQIKKYTHDQNLYKICLLFIQLPNRFTLPLI